MRTGETKDEEKSGGGEAVGSGRVGWEGVRGEKEGGSSAGLSCCCQNGRDWVA